MLTQNVSGLTALLSDLARLLLSFLPGRAISSQLCEPHGTMAVCLPARTGPVFVQGAGRFEVCIVAGEAAEP